MYTVMYAPEYFYIHHPYCLSKENEKETAMENEEKQQDEKQVRESGQLILDKNDESHRIYLLSITGKLRGMRRRLQIRKQQNMSIYCRCSPQWKTAVILMVF